VDAGAALHYVLSYGNRGTSTLSAGTLSIPLPPGTMLQSAPGAIVLDDLVSWPLGDLAAGASGEHELFVVPDAGSVQGQPVLAQALLSSGAIDERAETLTNVYDGSTLGLVTALGPNPVAPGQMLSLAVTVTNNAPVSLFG